MSSDEQASSGNSVAAPGAAQSGESTTSAKQSLEYTDTSDELTFVPRGRAGIVDRRAREGGSGPSSRERRAGLPPRLAEGITTSKRSATPDHEVAQQKLKQGVKRISSLERSLALSGAPSSVGWALHADEASPHEKRRREDIGSIP